MTMAAANSNTARVFFLGAHKVLLQTEVRRLRELGFEVFNPPYLSPVDDQSAQQAWDADQFSTLPREVFLELARYNFFYTPITPRIAEILNAYFDAVIVTIVARWAIEVVRVFHGTVVFRTYGQTSLLSSDLRALRGRSIIEEHPDFNFCPFASEVLDDESRWLADRARIIPYSPAPDIYAMTDLRDENCQHGDDILISAPNIAGNIFHTSHYLFLKEFFYHPHYVFLGVQGRPVDDPQVLGTLTREQQLQRMVRAAGYLYTYRNPRVCYLPPIEMMVLGGPVVYLEGSLLARYFPPNAPGCARNVHDAHVLCDRLRAGETGLIAEMRAAQSPVRDRYDPTLVWPLFDSAMKDMIRVRRHEPPPPPAVPTIGRVRDFLQNYLAEHGDSADPRTVVDIVGGMRRRRSKDDEPLIHRDVIGRDNLLFGSVWLNLGRWFDDPNSGSREWRCEEGAAGPVLRVAGLVGTARSLTLRWRARGLGVVATAELRFPDESRRTMKLAGGKIGGGRLTVDLDHAVQTDPDGSWHLEINSTGAAAFSLLSVSVG